MIQSLVVAVCERQLSESFLEALDAVDESGFAPSGPVRLAVAAETIRRPRLRGHKFRRHSMAEKANSWTLGQVAERIKEPVLRSRLLEHASEEMNHCYIFHSLADLGRSPQDCIEDFSWLLEKEKEFMAGFDGDVIGFICDTHAAEVRTYFSLHAYLEPLVILPEKERRQHTSAINRVLDDEARHIRYTAYQIDDWIRQGLDLRPRIQEAFAVYNLSDWQDVTLTAEFVAKDLRSSIGFKEPTNA